MAILHQLSRAFNRKQRHLALISIAQEKLIFFLFINSNAENYISTMFYVRAILYELRHVHTFEPQHEISTMWHV